MMKRFLLLLFVFMCFTLDVSAKVIHEHEVFEVETNKEVIKRRQKIQEVGYKLLNANKIDKRINFVYAERNRTVNAYATWGGRTIVVTKGMINYLDSDDELAYIIGHEISHCVDFYRGPFRGFFSLTFIPSSSRRVESRSDIRSLDYMVKAGYNPAAALIAANKIFDQPRYEFMSSHPLGSRRLANMYTHIYRKYPYFLVNNAYINNPVYQNFLLNSQENRLKLQDALEEEKNTHKVKNVKFK